MTFRLSTVIAPSIGVLVAVLIAAGSMPLMSDGNASLHRPTAHDVTRWVPVVAAGSNISIGPCLNESNASAGFWFCLENFTVISFSINASAYLTGNLSSTTPITLFVTESRWVGLVECYASEVLGCPGPYDQTIPVIGSGTFAHFDMGNLAHENNTTLYPLTPGSWSIVIGCPSYFPSVNVVEVTSTISYSM